MNQIKQKLSKDLSKLLGVEINPDNFSYPPNSELGDLALPCFDIAKEKNINPAEAATQLADELKGKFDYLEEVKTAGPYLNFKFSITELFALLNVKGKRSNVSKVMIEYSQPNTHKEFHVGHLRNACLGASLVELNRYVGNKVIAATYVNDLGIHVAKCLWNLLENHKDDKLPEDKGQYLGEIYAEAEKRMKEDESKKEEVSQVLQKMESKEKSIYKRWKETRDWSIDGFERIYNKLNIKFDKWYFESDCYKKSLKMVDELLDKKIAKKSEGAIIADLNEYNLDVLVLLKSDGSTVYATSDLALAVEKDKQKADDNVYVVDNRQTLYFKQIFKILELMGHVSKRKHVAYDFVTLPDGSMSSRQGNVISFNEFFVAVKNQSLKETKKKHEDWTDEQVDDVAEKISLAAIKFWMLKYDNNKVIVFDPKKALAFDGDTGPYLLYTVARINSIFEKANLLRSESFEGQEKQENNKVKKQNYELLKDKSERDLVLQIGKFDEVVEKVVREYAPIGLSTYLIELAQKINNFYHKCPVLDAETDLKEARLALLSKSKETLEKGLKLLNIETVSKM